MDVRLKRMMIELRLGRGSTKEKQKLPKKKIGSVGSPHRHPRGENSLEEKEQPRVSLKITYCSFSGLLNKSTTLHAPTNVSFTPICPIPLYPVN